MLARLLPRVFFCSLLCFVPTAPRTMNASMVTSVASARNTLVHECSATQSATGENTATASALCDVAGDRGSAFVSASFFSITSNSLVVVASSVAPTGDFGANVYAFGDASWSQDVVVRGGTGGGLLEFQYVSQYYASGDPFGIICEIHATPFDSFVQPCGSRPPELFPFLFDTPFNWSTSVYVRTVVPNYGSGGVLQSAALSVTYSLADIRVRYMNPDGSVGDVIAGARVELVPEPGMLPVLAVAVVIGRAALTLAGRSPRYSYRREQLVRRA
jgi:hypothetical protein